MTDDTSNTNIYFAIIPCHDEKPIENITLPNEISKSNGDQISNYLVESFVNNQPVDDNKLPCEIEVTPLLRPPSSSFNSKSRHKSESSACSRSFGIYAYSYTNFVIGGNTGLNNSNSRKNIRATTLAMAVGLHHKRFYGDVYIGKVKPNGQNESLRKEEIDFCRLSPDLRPEILNTLLSKEQKSTELASISYWLGDAMRDNYRDGGSIAQLAKVMGLRGDLNSPDSEDTDGTDEDDDDDSVESDFSREHKEVKGVDEKAIVEQKKESIFNSTLCIHCRGPTSTLCSKCGGVYFCSSPRTCQHIGWSHECICSTWKIYTERRTLLSTFPFSWHHSLITPPNILSEEPYREFLEDNKLLNQGFWSTELGGWWASTQKDKYKRDDSPTLFDPDVRQSYQDGFGSFFDPSRIPPQKELSNKEISTMKVDFNTNMVQLHSWKEYYHLRNIPLSSPVALLLTFPLTMYYAIQQYGAVPLIVSKMLRRPMRVHVVGVEKELNFLDLFQEVSFLLPSDIRLELVFVVRKDMLPAQYKHQNNIRIQLTPNMELWLVSGTYGSSSDLDPNFDCGTGPPDMIMGMNAGIYAYDSWRSVVQYLDLHPTVVGVFTDYNEHSAVNCARSLGGQKCLESVSVNPFRQPRAMPVRCMNLPQFSNGFMYACNEQELDM